MKNTLSAKIKKAAAAVITGLWLLLPSLSMANDRPVIVMFHQKPGDHEAAIIHGAKGIIKRTFDLIPAMAVTLPEEELERLKNDSAVAFIEEDAVFTAVEPLAGIEYTNSWGVSHILSYVAHQSGNRGTGVKVAVLDTGIDYNHPDLAGNYKGGTDIVFRDADPFDDSTYSHGTHIAGIIAGRENGLGVIGVAPEAEIYAVKVLDGGGAGLLSWIIAGIQWAVNNGMDIINLSLEGRDFLSLHNACDAAYNAGVLLVAAAGNWSTAVSYPAAYQSVIAVTATDASDMPAFFVDAPEVEMAAPGVDILSACSMTKPACAVAGGYRLLTGTSQATAHVSGTAALFFNSVDDLNVDGVIDNLDVREALQTTARDLGPAGRDTVFGFGLVNAAAASFPADISFTLTRTARPPQADAVTETIEGTSFEIKIKNNGLSRIAVDVYQSGARLRDLSSAHIFPNDISGEVTFILDATNTRYDVVFTPFGMIGKSADVLIGEQR